MALLRPMCATIRLSAVLATMPIVWPATSLLADAPKPDPEAPIQRTAGPKTLGRHLLYLTEDPYPEDKDSFLYQDPSVVPYHEYAASGDVTAQVVYANSGSP